MAGNAFPHQITIQAKTTTNTNGGQVTSYANSYTNIAALIAPATGSQRMIYAQRNSTLTHSIYTETTVTANYGDIVVFGSRQFFILNLLNILEGGRLYQLDCREIPGSELIVEGR